MFSFSGTTSFSWTVGIMQLVGEHLSGGQSQISSWPNFSQVTVIPLPPPKGLAGTDQGLQRREYSAPFVFHCWPSCCQYSPCLTGNWISSWLKCTVEPYSFLSRDPRQALFGTYGYIIITYIQLATTILLSFLLKLLRSEAEMSPKGTDAERMSCRLMDFGRNVRVLGCPPSWD